MKLLKILRDVFNGQYEKDKVRADNIERQYEFLQKEHERLQKRYAQSIQAYINTLEYTAPGPLPMVGDYTQKELEQVMTYSKRIRAQNEVLKMILDSHQIDYEEYL